MCAAAVDMLPHPVPYNLYDPWGVMKDATEEQKAKGRITEINNGRLAMLGLMGFCAEAKVRDRRSQSEA